MSRALILVLVLAGAPALAADLQGLAESLEGIRIEGRVPAMGVAILDEGRPVLLRTYGEAEPTTPFRWGSITKSFTALAALQLAREHHLDLHTPVRPLLGPGYYVNPWAASHPVRLVDLLELSAGFPDLAGSEFSDNEPLTLWQALERNQSTRRTLWPPGLQHSYSNLPPGLTAAVIEKVSGLPFETYLETRVLNPVGMKSASLDPVPGLPEGFKADGVTVIPYWHMTFKGFGALNASVLDMSSFATILLNGGRSGDRQVLPEDLVKQFFTPTATLGVSQGLSVSYAAGVYGWVRNGHVFWGHGGDADGYRSRYGLLPNHGRGYLLVINTDNPQLLGRMRRLVETALSSDLSAHPVPFGHEQDLAQYAGTYYPASTRFGYDRWSSGELPAATVRLTDAGLEFERRSTTTRLISVGDGRFIRPADPAVTVVFTRDGNGVLYLQGELGNYVNLSIERCPAFLAHCE